MAHIAEVEAAVSTPAKPRPPCWRSVRRPSPFGGRGLPADCRGAGVPGAPVLLTMLGDGQLYLSGIAKSAPHLTRETRGDPARAANRSKREIDELPLSSPTGRMCPTMRSCRRRRCPSSFVQGSQGDAPWPDGIGRPDSVRTELLKYSFSSRAEGPGLGAGAVLSSVHGERQATRQAGAASSAHALTSAGRRSGALIEQAVTEKLERLEARRFAVQGLARGPGATQCVVAAIPSGEAYCHGADGSRCRSSTRRADVARSAIGSSSTTGFLGLHGDECADICLMCPTHNRYLAELDYGRKTIDRHRKNLHGPTWDEGRDA